MCTVKLQNLRTGKPHISFSELSSWNTCTWRHKLQQIDKVDIDKRGPALDFGIAVHSACEDYLRTRSMKPDIALSKIREAWEKHGHPELDAWLLQAQLILSEVPGWLSENFPNWRYIKAEEMLYEPIQGHPHAFKGYIDGVIISHHMVRKKMKRFVWLLDWKTTNWGWHRYKKQDPGVRVQLIYYKNYWCRKHRISPKDVRCAFVLLKRTAKPGAHCELLPVSIGPVTTERALKVVNNMIHSVQAGIALKNRHSCTYCPYFETEHCTWMPPSRHRVMSTVGTP